VLTSAPEPQDSRIALPSGLKMQVRRYAGGDRTPAICIPGLTRNARDFEDFAPWLAGTGRDVLVVSLRGRGASDYDPNYLNYHPIAYRDDILAALDQLKLDRAIFVGTSLGGIVTMLTNEAAPSRVAAAIINDVGPELAPEGIARIAGYAGNKRPDAASLEEATDQIRLINEVAFPGRASAFWRSFALRTYRETPGGRWVLDYDQAIGKALMEVGPAPDLWPAFASLRDKPTLIVRGALSDLLTPPIIEKMRAANPALSLCEVANTGHAPTLSEPEVHAATTRLLRSVDTPGREARGALGWLRRRLGLAAPA
jgi:pimeloyl-ACP methyl ester carboxylesterase